MILLELFNRTEPVERLSYDDPLYKGGWEEAYTMMLNGEEFCFYFVDLMDNKFVFNFGVVNDPDSDQPYVAHGLTERGGQFKVFAAAAMILRDFIERKHPLYVEVSGAQERQTDFYKKALHRATMPEGYELWTHDKTMVIRSTDYSLESN